jgi:hypothetical protein
MTGPRVVRTRLSKTRPTLPIFLPACHQLAAASNACYKEESDGDVVPHRTPDPGRGTVYSNLMD